MSCSVTWETWGNMLECRTLFKTLVHSRMILVSPLPSENNEIDIPLLHLSYPLRNKVELKLM